MQNQSHTVDSEIPNKAQQEAPQGLKKNLPDNVHDTGSGASTTTDQSHAKGGGEASIIPQGLQEKLPMSVECAIPNALHDTGDEGGLHRKQNED